MPIPVNLTDEQAALIWSGGSVDLGTLDIPETPEQTQQAAAPEEGTPALITPIDQTELSNVFAGESEDDDDEPALQQPPTATTPATPSNTPVEKKKKTSDLLSVVNQLVTDEVLFGFEDGEIKTVDDVKDLIKLNLEQREKTSADKYWKDKVNTYSPQIQAVLHYAENGGRDLSTLIGAISNVEQMAELTLDTVEGQEAIVTEALRMKGLEEDEVKEQVEVLKDLDRLKSKAERYLPEINKFKQQQVQQMLVEQQENELRAKEASRIYFQTIESELNKDGFKTIPNNQKAKLFEAVVSQKYKSITGIDTNEFVKTLEDLQFGNGNKKNYEKFLKIVQYVVDEDSFMKNIEQQIQTKLTADTVKKLKTAKQTTHNTEIDPVTNRRNTVARSEFKNPFA